jgi:hypothetical protein
MPTTVNVTAEHIAQGVQESCSHCPIALALDDAFPDATAYANGATFDLWFHAGDAVRFSLPGEAEDFIARFDDDGFGEPFSFTVDYPEVSA